jgi:hypothetical protein
MTDLTAQQMIERILQSLEETGKRFQRNKKPARAPKGSEPKSRRKSNSAPPSTKKGRNVP